MTKEDVLNKLSSSKSIDRRKASKEIGQQKIIELGEALFDAYAKEKKDSRTWETKVEMILALGLIGYRPSLYGIQEIIKVNNPHDMVTYAAAQSYVRLKRKSINDASPVIELLKFGGLSLVDGALVPLGHDHMRPAKDEILKLIELGWDLHRHKDRIGNERGYSDPRYGLALACSGWDKHIVLLFLNHCLETLGNDSSMKKVVENAIKGKYVRLR